MTSSATQNDDDMNSEDRDMDVIRFHVVDMELDRGKPAWCSCGQGFAK